MPRSPGSQSLNPALVREALYHDCSDEVAAWAIRQLQPIEPFNKRILWRDSSHTVEKRTYIFCKNDRDVHPITQQKVLDYYPCQVVRLASGHFPFLSQPAQLLHIVTSAPKERTE